MRAVKGLATLLAASSAVVLMVGCDAASSASDKQAKADVKEAGYELSIATKEHQENAKTKLEGAAKSTDASPVTRAQASAMLAQQRIDFAFEKLRDIDSKELAMSRVAAELEQLAVQLDMGNVLVTDYSKYDPTPARNQILAKIAEAQGGPDKPAWFQQDKMVIPTLSAVKQTISQQQGDIAKLEDQVKSLTDQRNAVLVEADSAAQSSEAAKGEQAVNEYKRGSDLRKKAADFYTQIDQLNAQMIPLQRDLAIATGQQEVLDNVVKQLNAQLSALDSGWKSIRSHLDAQQALARKLVGENSSAAPAAPTTSPSALLNTGATIAEKAATINKMATEIKELRGEAESNLTDANKYFGDAVSQAKLLSQDLSKKIGEPANANRPEKTVWDSLRSVMDPQVYVLRQASAERMLGSLYASDAVSLSNRINLAASVGPVIERSGASVPADLRPDELGKNLKSALTQAEEAYTASDNLLALVTDGNTYAKETKEGANVERILTLYGASQVAKLNGDQKAAKDFLSQAIQRRNEAAEANAHLPALPAEMGAAPVPSTQPTGTADAATTAPSEATAPTTAPATEPTDAPATSEPAPTAPTPASPTPAAPAPN